MVNADIEVNVDPVAAWAVDDTYPGYGDKGRSTDYIDLIPICLTAGHVEEDTNCPPDCYVVPELSEIELETAVSKLVDTEWATEDYQAEKAGLRWRIEGTNYSLTGLPDQFDDAPRMTKAQQFAFKEGDGGEWAIFDGVDADKVSRFADNIDAYVAVFRAEHLLEAVKFVPVSVAELVVPPTTGRVDRAVGEE